MLPSVDQKHHQDHIYKFKSIELLKTAALYGANGAGKSNFFKAVETLKVIVQEGGKDTLSRLKKFKLDDDCKSLPTTFEIEFIKDSVVYLYGLIIDNEIIAEEWLYKSGFGKKKDEIIFHRSLKNDKIQIKFSKKYTDTDERRISLNFVQANLVESNTLLLKVLSDLKEGFKEIKNIYEWFDEDLIVIFPNSKPGSLILQLIDSEGFKSFAKEALCSFHTGISDIDISTFPIEEYLGESNKVFDKVNKDLKAKKQSLIALRTKNHTEQIVAMLEDGEPVIKRFIGRHENRNGDSVDFFLEEESDGTNRLLDLLPAMYDFLTNHSVLLIDEINQSIHPILLKEIIKKFVSDKRTKGQFVFSTHEVNLLDQDIFRRDEIWFVEKDRGETKMYPLSEYNIRFDLDIRKGYLSGRFGAIPFTGNLHDLNWNAYAEES